MKWWRVVKNWPRTAVRGESRPNLTGYVTCSVLALPRFLISRIKWCAEPRMAHGRQPAGYDGNGPREQDAAPTRPRSRPLHRGRSNLRQEVPALKALHALLPAFAFCLLTLSAPATTSAQAPAGAASATVIAPDGVNLRAGPTTASPILATIPFASIVALHGPPTPDHWYPIRYGALSGWSLGDFLAAGQLDPLTAQSAPSLTSGATPMAFSVAAPAPTAVAAPAYSATASYYGIDDAATAGRPMACGGLFDPWDSAAVSTNDWPCGTRLRVTGPDGHSIDVTVTDHGQYPSHWLDLTYAAFARLADHRVGTISVSVQVLP